MCDYITYILFFFFFFFQAEDGIRDVAVTGVQTCALPICFFQLMVVEEAGPVSDRRQAVRPDGTPGIYLNFAINNEPFGPSTQDNARLEIGRASCRERV